jgi:hypothetical protein
MQLYIKKHHLALVDFSHPNPGLVMVAANPGVVVLVAPIRNQGKATRFASHIDANIAQCVVKI